MVSPPVSFSGLPHSLTFDLAVVEKSWDTISIALWYWAGQPSFAVTSLFLILEIMCLFPQWANVDKSVHRGRASNMVRCGAPGFLSWRQLCECHPRRQTAGKASAPCAFHSEGLIHISLWPSDPQLVRERNEQLGLNDLKAAMWCFLSMGAESWRAGPSEKCTAPLPAYQHPAVLGVPEPPREVGPPHRALAKTGDWQPNRAKMERGTWHINCFFFLLLFAGQVPLWITCQEFHPVLRH